MDPTVGCCSSRSTGWTAMARCKGPSRHWTSLRDHLPSGFIGPANDYTPGMHGLGSGLRFPGVRELDARIYRIDLVHATAAAPGP